MLIATVLPNLFQLFKVNTFHTLFTLSQKISVAFIASKFKEDSLRNLKIP